MQHGSQSIVDTLIRGVHKFGGRVAVGFHVTSILPESSGTALADAEAPAAVAPPVPAAAVLAADVVPPPVATAAASGAVMCAGRLGGVAAGTASQGAGADRSVAAGATSSGGSSAFGWPTGPGASDGAKAGGVEMRAADGSVHSVRARRAVICNASVWDTVGLLDAGGLRGGLRPGVARQVAEEASLRRFATNGSGNGAERRDADGSAAARGPAGVPGSSAPPRAAATEAATDPAFEEYVRALEMNESMMHLHVGFTARDGARPTANCFHTKNPRTCTVWHDNAFGTSAGRGLPARLSWIRSCPALHSCGCSCALPRCVARPCPGTQARSVWGRGLHGGLIAISAWCRERQPWTTA